MIKLVLFDLDNTLLDFESMKVASVRAAINEMCKEGLNVDSETALKDVFRIYNRDGWEFHFVFQQFLKDTLGYVDLRLLAFGVNAYRRERERTLKLYRDVKRILTKLKIKGLKLAIVTDAPELQAWIRLTKLKIDKYFDFIVADGKDKKRTGKPFKKALKISKTTANEALVVGDSWERDLQPAQKLGMNVCFAKYGNKKKINIPENVRVANRFSDILKLF